MIRTTTFSDIDGYGSGQTDFLAQLAASDEQHKLDFEANVIQPLLAVLSSPDQIAVLTITGHGDRVDLPDLTREQRRQQELTASQARSESAAAGVVQILRERVLGFLPDDFEEVQQIAILPRAAGAAVLREFGDFLSEDQRKINRRVQMRVVHFVPG